MPITAKTTNNKRSLIVLILIMTAILGVLVFYLTSRRQEEPRLPYKAVSTIAGAGTANKAARFSDPFGIAVAPDQTIYLSDGQTGVVWEIKREGEAKVIAENLDTPSAVALAPDGTLVVADTGSHTIKRIDLQSNSVITVAGVERRAGFADGSATEALFNGPIGVAVNQDGTIFVADTYNDRIRAIDAQGSVRTIAGGSEPGFMDSLTGAEARFDTPCGIALDLDGTLIVADTGNNRLRRVSTEGIVTTVAGTGEPKIFDGPLFAASFHEPVGVAVDVEGNIYIAEAGGSAVRVFKSGVLPFALTLAGGADYDFADGALNEAGFNRPSGIAISVDGTLLVADTGNKLIRAITTEKHVFGEPLSRNALGDLRPSATELRAASTPRWPFDPPEKTREIAATFGEIRGEIKDGKQAWFHSGLDIPGAYGETVRAVRAEKVLRPISIEGVGTARERVRFPTLGYIHLRVGRNRSDQKFDDDKFAIVHDAEGRVTNVRVRRGARFAAGDALGTLNDQYHVHLISGPTGAELNALAALELPGIRDTVSPIIEKNGVLFLDRDGRPFQDASSSPGKKRGPEARGEPIAVHGDVRIVVRAYDQMDGNAKRRRLGVYRLGYQILDAHNRPAPGFEQLLTTISFESLPENQAAVQIAYAPGSKSGYSRETIFAYIVTNMVRDRAARESFWQTSKLGPGEYTVRVFIEDFFGNRTTNDTTVRVIASPISTGKEVSNRQDAKDAKILSRETLALLASWRFKIWGTE